MKDKQSTNSAFDLQVMAAIQRRKFWTRAITAAAIGLWLIAVAGSSGLLGIYEVFYRPKEKQLLLEMERIAAASPRPQPGSQAPLTTERALTIHYSMTYLLTKGMLLMTAMTIVLSAGTLLLLILVVMQRRSAMEHVNAGLAQVSAQLLELKRSGRESTT